MLAGLYRQRWRIEDALGTVKSPLGLSYFLCGADNAVQVQPSATWILCAVLVNVTDAVAEVLVQPFADISMEMAYRALYHYVRAIQQNEAQNLIAFLSDEHKLPGLVKRKKPVKPTSRPHSLTDDEDA